VKKGQQVIIVSVLYPYYQYLQIL